MKLKFLTLGIILIFHVDQRVSAQDSTILWTDDVRLVWGDFLAEAPKVHEASAMTDATLSVDMHSEADYLVIHIEPVFNRYRSWSKEEERSDELLKHEQIHFDIHELNARRLRAALKGRTYTMKNVSSTVNKILEEHNKKNFAEQERYDRETKHSLNKEKQLEWNKYVETELKKLKSHSATTFKVKLAP